MKGFRRVFAHSAAVFHERGIARTDTNEVGSLSCEEHEGQDLLMTVFEVPATEQTFQVLTERLHPIPICRLQMPCCVRLWHEAALIPCLLIFSAQAWYSQLST